MKIRKLMKTIVAVVAIAVLAVTQPTPAFAQDNEYTFEGGYPAAGTAEKVYDASDLRRAIEAYKFFYPTMGLEAVIQQMLANSGKINEVGHVMAASPKIQFGTTNADTPYALAALDLKAAGPIVIDLPPGVFIGVVDDHNMRWLHDIGTIGPEKGKGGKHLFLPPGYEGEVPDGYYVARSKTWKIVPAIRIFPVGGDVAKAIESANDIKIYPLAKAGEPVTFRYIDVSDKTMALPVLSWETNIEYFRQLHAVIQEETSPLEFRPMLGMLAQLGIKKGHPFNPDDRMKRILNEAAQTGINEMRTSFFSQRLPEFEAWEGSYWENLIVQPIEYETGDFGGLDFYDLEKSEAYYFMGFGVSPAMRIEPGAGSVYWAGFRDNTGAYLDGGKTYKLTVPGPVPGKLFWSHTVYDTNTRTLIATDQNQAAIRSHIEDVQENENGSYDLYFGPEAPEGKESMWIKTIPGSGWWSLFRIYGPVGPAFDGTWKLNDFVEMK